MLWQEGIAYQEGATVEFNNRKYSLLIPHTSQINWTPDQSPNIWKLEETATNDFNVESKIGTESIPNTVKLETKQVKPVKPSTVLIDGYLYLTNYKVPMTLPFNTSEWMKAAVKRRTYYHSLQDRKEPLPPVYWILTQSNCIPSNAIPLGNEHEGIPLYAARAYFKNGLHVGKVSPTMERGMELPWGQKAHTIYEYEILVGNPSAVKWIDGQGFLKAPVQVHNNNFLVDGGNNDKFPLYVGRTHFKGGIHVGKTGPDCDGCFIAYGDKEHYIPNYQYLVYRS
ncbi:hypothetical protein BC833DRAFT_607925 [Globomyces pollinis-pini]|nr:hypothetical protein BC833DRAFT_607925 [Globomyces pollinis-pini]